MNADDLNAIRERADASLIPKYHADVPVLLAEIARLRAALEPFGYAARWFDHLSDEYAALQEVALGLKVTDLRAAHSVLQEDT